MVFHSATVVNEAVYLILYMLSLFSFKNQWAQFSLCCQGTICKQWMDFHMLSLLFY